MKRNYYVETTFRRNNYVLLRYELAKKLWLSNQGGSDTTQGERRPSTTADQQMTWHLLEVVCSSCTAMTHRLVALKRFTGLKEGDGEGT